MPANINRALQLAASPAFLDMVRAGLLAVAADVMDDPPDPSKPQRTLRRRAWAKKLLPPARPELLDVATHQTALVIGGRGTFSNPPTGAEVQAAIQAMLDTIAQVEQEER